MPKPDKYVPTHRAPGKHKAVRAPRRVLRTGVALTGLAAAATGITVSGGLLSSDPSLAPAAADVSGETSSQTSSQTSDAPTMSAADLEQRAQRQTVSRSAVRQERSGSEKAAALSVSSGTAVTKSEIGRAHV